MASVGRDFQSRAAALFERLNAPGAPEAAAPWTVSQNLVLRRGKTEYSSDEEEETAALQAEAERKEFLPPSFLNLSADGGDDHFTPSAAFCQALDKEEEFDQNDAQAMLLGRDEFEDQQGELASKLAAKRQAQAQAAADSMPDLLDEPEGDAMDLDQPPIDMDQPPIELDQPPSGIDQPMDKPSSYLPSSLQPQGFPSINFTSSSTFQPSSEQAESSRDAVSRLQREEDEEEEEDDEQRRAEKRPKLAEKQTRLLESALKGAGGGLKRDQRGGMGRGEGTSGGERREKPKKVVRFAEEPEKPERQETPGRMSVARARAEFSASQRGENPRNHRRSVVPDHVRNPGKYTCYTLDEPIEVGSGRTGDEGEDLTRAVRAAQSAALAASAQLPTPSGDHLGPGGKVEFIPKAKRDLTGAGERAGERPGERNGQREEAAKEAAQRVNDSAAWAFLAATALEEDEVPPVLASSAAPRGSDAGDPELKAVAPKKRHFRSKAKNGTEDD